MIWNGYDVTLYVGQLHLITFYRTENCFLKCALVFLGSFCVPFTNSLIKFYFITIIIKVKYMGTTRHFSLVTNAPSQSIGLVYWVCVVLVLSLICVPFVDTRGEVIERFSNKHNLCILNDGTHTYLKPQAHHANKPTSAIDSQFPHQDLLWEVCERCCRIPSHDEVYTDGSKMNEKVGAAAVINRHFQNG